MQTPINGSVYSRSSELLPQTTTASWVAAPMQAPGQMYRPAQVPLNSYIQPAVQVIQTRSAPLQQISYGSPYNQSPVYSVYQPQQLPMNVQRPSFVSQGQDQLQSTGWSMPPPMNQQRPASVPQGHSQFQGAVRGSSIVLKPSVEASFSTDVPPASPKQSSATSPSTPGTVNLVPSFPALAELALEPKDASVVPMDEAQGDLETPEESPEATPVELSHITKDSISDDTAGNVERVGNLLLATTDDQKVSQEPLKQTKSEQPLEGCFGFIQRVSKLCGKTHRGQTASNI